MKKRHNVHGKGTQTASRKKELALALCVSLWMAGGSVASAEEIYINADNDTVHIDEVAPPLTADIMPGNSAPAPDRTLTVTGGDWAPYAPWSIYGGKGSDANEEGGYTLNLTEVQKDVPNADNKINYVYGGYNHAGPAKDNTVNIDHSTVGSVIGGYSNSNGIVIGGYSNSNGIVTGNIVHIYNSSSVIGDVYGGHSNKDEATGNTVIIDNSKVGGEISGGSTSKENADATGNNVSLTGATVTGDVYGGHSLAVPKGEVVNGNTLYLSGANSAKSIANFDTVYIGKALDANKTPVDVPVAWQGEPVLKLTTDVNANNVKSIDAENIAFSGAVKAGENTTLIQGGMTGYPEGQIKSGKFKVGTTTEGTGHTAIEDANLVYYADTLGNAREQTHNTVMGAEVGMAALSTGNDFIGAATEGLSLAANTGADGIASFAQMGGAAIRQETGSHVDVHTWNAILGLGHQNKKERGTMEYGAFFEYGTGNYTTHAENDLRGDGSARYTGGGLLAKYTMKNDVYVEGSLRAGSIHDDARNVMSDGAGNPYSYETNAPYFGFHLGVGKEIAFDDIHSVDVYGKYFFNRKNGVSFDAGGHYDLDAVTSSVIRMGARYIVKRDKWNFYAGAAYEHELDGKANGTADGVAIRGADTSGGSFRGELGATMKPGKNSPWSLDLNVSGFAGKKQGFTGGVSVAFMF